jgi:hypothetical protein
VAVILVRDPIVLSNIPIQVESNLHGLQPINLRQEENLNQNATYLSRLGIKPNLQQFVHARSKTPTWN